MAMEFTLGADVMTNDQHKVGLLKEVHGEYLKISGGDPVTEFWLPASSASEAGRKQLTLSFPIAQLGGKKVPDTQVRAA